VSWDLINSIKHLLEKAKKTEGSNKHHLTVSKSSLNEGKYSLILKLNVLYNAFLISCINILESFPIVANSKLYQ